MMELLASLRHFGYYRLHKELACLRSSRIELGFILSIGDEENRPEFHKIFMDDLAAYDRAISAREVEVAHIKRSSLVWNIVSFFSSRRKALDNARQ